VSDGLDIERTAPLAARRAVAVLVLLLLCLGGSPASAWADGGSPSGTSMSVAAEDAVCVAPVSAVRRRRSVSRTCRSMPCVPPRTSRVASWLASLPRVALRLRRAVGPPVWRGPPLALR
jgi:hypothetical protein